MIAGHSVDSVNRTRRIDHKTFCLGFPRYLTLFGSPQPNCGTVFHNSYRTFVVAFSVLRVKALFRLFFVVLQPCSV